MLRAELMGAHTHTTLCGKSVHVYRRGGRYIARGRYRRQIYGETLGENELAATSRLRQILVQIENGSFVRPSENSQRLLGSGQVLRLTLRELANEFLSEKRKVRGQKTASTYRSRLSPVLDFAEIAASRQRWPLAADINREFVIGLRVYLQQLVTTRNGRPGGSPKRVLEGHIVNFLECLRTMLAWARKAEIRKLPADFVNPLTPDLVGSRPRKDPLRQDKLPLTARIQLVALMDSWQLCQLALSVVLPLRPEEAAGLLVSEVDFDKGWLAIGTRLGGADFTKGHTSFKLPFPAELRPLLVRCIGNRAEGPLLQNRRAFEGKQKKMRRLASREELLRLYEEELTRPANAGAITAQDKKRVFRRLLRKLGGVSEDKLARECKTLLEKLNIAGASLYTLRESVTTAMERANVRQLDLRYLTSHTTNDILNDYVVLDPVGAMRPYFDSVRPLLLAITDRAKQLGLLPSQDLCAS